MTNAPDLSEFDALARPKTRRACKLGTARAALTPEDQVKLDAALALYSPGPIWEWLDGRGHGDVTISAIVMHRNRKCACARGRG